MRVIALASASALCLGLFGCGKIQSLIKGEPGADAAASAAAPTPSAPEVAPVPDAAATAVATTATATATAATTRPAAPKKDAGGADAAADAAVAVADAGADSGAPAATRKPTRGAFSCDATGCACEAGAGCQITCPGVSPCKVVVNELANASITGGLGAIDLECRKNSTCTLRGGVGASKVRCNGGKCTTDCGTGACDMTCSGGKCAINKKGAGAVHCSGTGCS